MKLRKKQNIGEESYWKSFTDIMAGLLLVILLILMLLLLLLSQMKDEEHKEDEQYPTSFTDHVADDYDIGNHEYDHQNDNDNEHENFDEGGGGGGGEDDPGTNDNEGRFEDVGHDKTAVFVTVVDEETGNVIKKEGTLFELYADRNANGGLRTLHTYYPTKVEYKQYETTEAGTFYLPEKITKGWYSLHNLTAPKGYGLADDVEFEIDESRDWSDPFLVEVPMSPSKGIIYIKTEDADTKTEVAGSVYEIYASKDVVTLDGTLRYRSGEKVDEVTCDEKGRGDSVKLYFGEYTIKQKLPAEYYALNTEPINVTLDYFPEVSKTYTFKCTKTKAVFTLTDQFSEEPIKGAVYAVSGREDMTTNGDGQIVVTDLDKSSSFMVTLKSVPEPYTHVEQPLTLNVDGNGFIDGSALAEVNQNAYIVRLGVDVNDIVFKNAVTGARLRLFDADDNVIDEWEANGSTHIIEGLEPGLYSLEINGSRPSTAVIDLKDNGNLQTLTTYIWTMWDTIAAAGAFIFVTLLVVVVISLIRRFRRKKPNEQ